MSLNHRSYKLLMFNFMRLLALLILASYNVQCVRQKRFIGGKDSEPHAWPWMGLLVSGGEDWNICGCSIVSNEWLLTAAHCVRPSLGDPLKYYVVLGDHNRFVEEGTEIRRNLSKVVLYPKYEQENHTFDVALLKMNEPVDFRQYDHIKPACLSLDGDYFEESRCTAIGWGRIGKYGRMPAILQQLDMKPFDHQKCAEIHHDFYQYEDSKEEVTENQFCMVSATKKEKDAKKYSSGSVCPGDSGGPIQCLIDGKWKQVGVAWSATTYNYYPSVFNYVCKYGEWIKKVTGIDENYCQSESFTSKRPSKVRNQSHRDE